jgi:hypothetical protein
MLQDDKCPCLYTADKIFIENGVYSNGNEIRNFNFGKFCDFEGKYENGDITCDSADESFSNVLGCMNNTAGVSNRVFPGEYLQNQDEKILGIFSPITVGELSVYGDDFELLQHFYLYAGCDNAFDSFYDFQNHFLGENVFLGENENSGCGLRGGSDFGGS